jgi:gamma-tubulin complex component 3
MEAEGAVVLPLQDELTEYYRLIALLESQLTRQGLTPDASGLTLRRLSLMVEDPLSRLRLLATLCDSLQSVRGGALASVLYGHTRHGDPMSRQVRLRS